MNRVQRLLSRDLKKLNIKPLPDEELHKLLVIATKCKNKKKKKEARKKILLHILPIIINRCKRFFPEDYLIENTDFINEVAMLIMDRAFDNFRIDEQEEGRCSLFFKAIHFYILLAYKNLKRKQFGTHEISYREFLNPKADKEFFQNINFLKENVEKYSDKEEREDLFMELSWDGDGTCIETSEEEFDLYNKEIQYPSELTEEEKIIEKKEKLQILNKEVFARCSLLDNILINSTGLISFPYAFSSMEIMKLWKISKRKIDLLKKYAINKVKDIAQFYLGKEIRLRKGVQNESNSYCSI